MAAGGLHAWLALALLFLVQHGRSSRLPRHHSDDHDNNLFPIAKVLPDWSDNCKLGLEALFAYGELQVESVPFDWLLVFGQPGHHKEIAQQLSRLELPSDTRELGYVYRHSLLNKYCKKLGASMVIVHDAVPIALQILYAMLKVDRGHGKDDLDKQLPDNFSDKVYSCVDFLANLKEFNRVHSAVDLVEAAKEFELSSNLRKVTNEQLCANALRHLLGNPHLAMSSR